MKNDYKSCISIAEIALIHDPLHESTLKMIVRSHVLLGETSLAEATYERFCERYYEAYNEEFPFELEELLEG